MSSSKLIDGLMQLDLELRLRRVFEHRYGVTRIPLNIFEIGLGVFRIQAPCMQKSMDYNTAQWRISVAGESRCTVHLPDVSNQK